jgi:hypothetical protein
MNWITDAGSIGTLLAALVGIFALLRGQNQTHVKQDAATAQLKQVHSLVNQQLDTVMDKNAALTAEVQFQKTQPAEE